MTTMRSGVVGATTMFWLASLALAVGCARAARIAPRDARNGRAAAPGAADSVAIAYGSQLRRDVTGAIGSVAAPRDRGQRVTHVGELILGRVPGVEVRRLGDGEYSVRIRGAAIGLG